MMKYSMKCSCGHVMSVDANSREEGVEKMKTMMDQNMLDQHWTQFHQNDTMPKPTLEQSHMQIEQALVEGETGEAGPGAPMPPTPPPAAPSMPPSMPPTGAPVA